MSVDLTRDSSSTITMTTTGVINNSYPTRMLWSVLELLCQQIHQTDRNTTPFQNPQRMCAHSRSDATKIEGIWAPPHAPPHAHTISAHTYFQTIRKLFGHIEIILQFRVCAYMPKICALLLFFLPV